jgi:hypothetical protein
VCGRDAGDDRNLQDSEDKLSPAVAAVIRGLSQIQCDYQSGSKRLLRHSVVAFCMIMAKLRVTTAVYLFPHSAILDPVLPIGKRH